MIARLGGLSLLLGLVVLGEAPARAAGRPNVVLIITDDQGYGDLGCDGNSKIHTPHLDRLARESVRLERFYVSPVCAPTRASLLTGRYAYRTGVVDTFIGRAMMHPDEVTLAEMLGGAGYRTGIFGKWHLGDNYPLRAMDQGFRESLVIRGGGIAQASDAPEPGGDSYFDPYLQHNGRQVRAKGYCSDVFTNAAMDFIAESRDRPFFAYLAFNAPHGPFQVPEDDHRPYRDVAFLPEDSPKEGQPLPPRLDQDAIARAYGMISNIDANLGRLFAKLEALGVADDTLVIFMTDNGPPFPRFNSGMRGLKASVYDGGIRVPCFVRWPARLRAQSGRAMDRLAAHIDLVPTILAACEVPKPAAVALDGRDLLPSLEGRAADVGDRTIYAQWHRGDVPELHRNFAARSSRYKLLRPESAGGRPLEQSLELYDMEADPFEFHNIASRTPEVVTQLLSGYEAWFRDVERTRGFAPPRILLGAPEENPSLLTRQDWRGPRAGWGLDSLGYWEVDVARAGAYSITLQLAARAVPATAHLSLGEVALARAVDPGAKECTFENVLLPSGPGRLQPWIDLGEKTVGVTYVNVKRHE